ncbi:MAG: class I SAM-dependent methyltransferase [Candidatus Omnitrophica bacterium]|nr:class I SAM-dependent methyltransferase [Candidatus Omnitrophota bacterium]
MIIKEFIQKDSGFFGQDVDSWTKNWNAVDSLIKSAKNSDKDNLSYFFKKYFPKAPKRILEGGCGTGKYVIAYRSLGYDMIGVDFSGATIKRIKESLGAGFPVYEGNVTALPFADGYFDCYYSGGVIEHFQDGPDAPLREARRVLKKGGLLLATVPYINLIRRLRCTFSPRRLKKHVLLERSGSCKNSAAPCGGYEFCEYIFDVRSLKPYFEKNGFSIEAAYPTDFLWGEIGLLLHGAINKRRNGPEHADCVQTDKNGGIQDAVKWGSTVRDMAYGFLVTEDRNNAFFRVPITLLNYLSGHMVLFVAKAV